MNAHKGKPSWGGGCVGTCNWVCVCVCVYRIVIYSRVANLLDCLVVLI